MPQISALKGTALPIVILVGIAVGNGPSHPAIARLALLHFDPLLPGPDFHSGQAGNRLDFAVK